VCESKALPNNEFLQPMTARGFFEENDFAFACEVYQSSLAESFRILSRKS